MVKSRFPGKPSKHFNRRKISVINNEDSDGVKEAEDVYRRLSVFNMLFSTKDEVIMLFYNCLISFQMGFCSEKGNIT